MGLRFLKARKAAENILWFAVLLLLLFAPYAAIQNAKRRQTQRDACTCGALNTRQGPMANERMKMGQVDLQNKLIEIAQELSEEHGWTKEQIKKEIDSAF